MNLHVHLSFNGQCEQAFGFYAQLFAGQVTYLLTFGKSPRAAEFPGMEDKVMHATLALCGHKLSGADVPPAQYVAAQAFSLQLNLDDELDARRIFDALAEGGNVVMALQSTFWARQYALVTDRFGVPWELNCS